MKTAVSIPDVLFAEADALAGRMGKNRSELYRDALAEFVARHEPQAITAALNELADELAEHSAFTNLAARQLLASSEW